MAKKPKPPGTWPRVKNTVAYSSIRNPVPPGPKQQRLPVGNRTPLRQAALIGILDGSQRIYDDHGRVVGRIKPTPGTLANDVTGRAGPKLKGTAYTAGYGRGDVHGRYREGMSLGLWASTARRGAKGRKGNPEGSLTQRVNIAAKVRQMRNTGNSAGVAGYMAVRVKRSYGSFKSRKGTWRKGHGGRFVGSGG